MFKALIALLTSLPEILRLIGSIQKQIEVNNAKRKVKDDFKAIDEAFTSGDVSKLNDIFKS